MNEMVNQLINLVLFIWLGKIVLNVSTFIQDPIAILAYPADSNAFYFGTILTLATIVYKGMRQKISVNQFVFAFIPVFLTASFLYEFMQIVWENMSFTWHEIGLLGGLLLVYMLIHDHVSEELSTILLVLGWGIGKLLLLWYLPFTTIFGYMINSWFIVLIVSILSVYNGLLYRKKVC